MHTDTAARRLTKRANHFLGMSLGQYIIEFTHVREHKDGTTYLWFNENATMQKTFAVWASINDREAKLTALLQERAIQNLKA